MGCFSCPSDPFFQLFLHYLQLHVYGGYFQSGGLHVLARFLPYLPPPGAWPAAVCCEDPSQGWGLGWMGCRAEWSFEFDRVKQQWVSMMKSLRHCMMGAFEFCSVSTISAPAVLWPCILGIGDHGCRDHCASGAGTTKCRQQGWLGWLKPSTIWQWPWKLHMERRQKKSCQSTVLDKLEVKLLVAKLLVAKLLAQAHAVLSSHQPARQQLAEQVVEVLGAAMKIQPHIKAKRRDPPTRAELPKRSRSVSSTIWHSWMFLVGSGRVQLGDQELFQRWREDWRDDA